ncbi:hypothetical protein D3C80_1549230 [compost metagenome]
MVDDQQHQQDPDGDRDIEKLAVAQRQKRLAFNHDRRAVGDDIGDTSEDAHRRDGYDKRRDTGQRSQATVNQAQHQRSHDRQRDHQNKRDAK